VLSGHGRVMFIQFEIDLSIGASACCGILIRALHQV